RSWSGRTRGTAAAALRATRTSRRTPRSRRIRGGARDTRAAPPRRGTRPARTRRRSAPRARCRPRRRNTHPAACGPRCRGTARRPHVVAWYDGWPAVARQASAFDLGGGVWIVRYYHHLFQVDSDMIALHDELPPGELEWHTSSVGIWARGRVWPFVSPMDLLRYRPLPIVDRLRLGYSVLRLTARTDWERMDDIGALDGLRTASGERALASVWTPLMLGKFGADSERVPLAWLWSKFRLRRKLRG